MCVFVPTSLDRFIVCHMHNWCGKCTVYDVCVVHKNVCHTIVYVFVYVDNVCLRVCPSNTDTHTSTHEMHIDTQTHTDAHTQHTDTRTQAHTKCT